MNVISIDEFDDTTLTRIFTSIVDWHFAKGFDGVFTRLGKVRCVLIYFIFRLPYLKGQSIPLARCLSMKILPP